MQFEDAYAAAARLDPHGMTLAQKRRLFGTSILKNAFEALQAEPWCLSAYQAARLVHFSVSRRTKENPVDVMMAFAAYVEARPKDEALDAAYDGAVRICQRAGVLDPKKHRVLLPLSIWLPDPAMLLDIVAPHPPVQHVRKAFEAEMKVVKRAVWKRN